jgi:hypothetical protein
MLAGIGVKNKAVVGIFNGPVVCFNIGIGLIFLARVVVLVNNFPSSCFDFFAVEYR